MNNHSAFDYGHNQSELGGYDDYDNPSTTQHSYYQNHNNYADVMPAHFPPSAAQQTGYNHGYPKIEGALKLRFNENIANDRSKRDSFISVYLAS